MKEYSSVFEAIEKGDLRGVRELTKEEHRIFSHDHKGETLLHYAAAKGDIRIASYLISRGAILDILALDGSTPLHRAAGEGHLSMVKYLVKSGASMRLLDNSGKEPVHWAHFNGHNEVTRYFQTLGVRISTVDRTLFEITQRRKTELLSYKLIKREESRKLLSLWIIARFLKCLPARVATTIIEKMDGEAGMLITAALCSIGDAPEEESN